MNGWIIGATVFTENEELENNDVYIENGMIKEVAQAPEHADVLLRAHGKLLSPGFIDVHVHLREPGGEHKETIETGTKAAAKGGFTTVCPMPNTRPVPDTAQEMKNLYARIKQHAHVHVLPYAAITTRQLGKERTDFERLKQAGAFAFTDDGVGVQDASTMLKAMKEAARMDMPIVAHCEENTLVNKGSVHEGDFSKKQGINGIPSAAESVHIARDVLLAEASGVHYHVCHVSTKESVRVIRDAKKAGIHVTAEVTPHHLLLTDEDIPGLDANFKMNPPLRSNEDRQALLEGWLDGTIDFIATDHAPHAKEEKDVGMEKAPFGITGLETAFPLLYKHLVKKGVCSLEQLLAGLTKKPASVFNLSKGVIAPGKPADITFIDLDKEETVDPHTFVSKGKNTPFTGWSIKGMPVATMVSGKIVYEKEGAYQS
ncbi:dihydroorotase [Alteribacillus persepolensis]|uniref:Dihydroorotase n=1 Tax=Alteribacillus persepolensis TaxID=568899 RepID=A0A1G7YGY3_9BACI|nr:dihydroorotase [Alteribacillus persepolensis]SDG95852.1 dihydroorotase [Alteribacillus persepolensis]